MNFLIKLCFCLITKHEKEQSNALRVRLSVTTNLNSEVNVTLYRYQVPAVSNDRQNITNVLAVVFVCIMRYFEDPWETCDVNIHEGSDWYFRYDSLRMTKILKKKSYLSFRWWVCLTPAASSRWWTAGWASSLSPPDPLPSPGVSRRESRTCGTSTPSGSRSYHQPVGQPESRHIKN